jgi:hypothetical protein
MTSSRREQVSSNLRAHSETCNVPLGRRDSRVTQSEESLDCRFVTSRQQMRAALHQIEGRPAAIILEPQRILVQSVVPAGPGVPAGMRGKVRIEPGATPRHYRSQNRSVRRCCALHRVARRCAGTIGPSRCGRLASAATTRGGISATRRFWLLSGRPRRSPGRPSDRPSGRPSSNRLPRLTSHRCPTKKISNGFRCGAAAAISRSASSGNK